MKDIRDYGLLEHNTFGIAASCKRFLEYSSIQEAVDLVSQLTDEDKIGRASCRERVLRLV